MMKRLNPMTTCVVALSVILPGTAALASTTTNVAIPAQTSGTLYGAGLWANNPYNSNLSAAIPTNGNQGTGITFADWAGMYYEVNPSTSAVFSIPSVLLGSASTVNALFNTFYGITGINAEITFANNLGQTAEYNLIGDDTIRDYNQNTYQNTLPGGSATLEGVTAENWWANGNQRLDVQTFYLPTSWAGSDLVSMTVFNPTAAPDNPDPDDLLSALQVVSANLAPVTVSATPEPSSLALLGTGALGLAGMVRRRFKR